ncbi:MAG: hypothetical protein ABFR90_04050 [Planctomycetota bacterium]
MNPTLKADGVTVGYHPAGYRIDKTAAAMDRYTQWQIDGNKWHSPKPVCFHSLPEDGWIQENTIAE